MFNEHNGRVLFYEYLSTSGGLEYGFFPSQLISMVKGRSPDLSRVSMAFPILVSGIAVRYTVAKTYSCGYSFGFYQIPF